MTAVVLSVVIPFYDEAENVAPLFAELLPVLEEMALPFEVVAVDDGSNDTTRAELARVRAAEPRVRVLVLAKNSGQSAAFDAGFSQVRGRLILTMDGDLQVDPRDTSLLLEALEREGADMAYGRRVVRRDAFSKRLSTKIANGVRNWLTGESIRDTGCPLKLMKREVARRFLPFNGMHRFFITMAHIDGFRTVEVPVSHRPRRHGASKYGIRNRVFRTLRDCFAMRWLKARRLAWHATELGVDGAPHDS